MEILLPNSRTGWNLNNVQCNTAGPNTLYAAYVACNGWTCELGVRCYNKQDYD